MTNGDLPNSIRIRCGPDNRHRYHAIQSAAELYGCNRSDAVAYACDNVSQLVQSIETILNRDDLTPQQKKEIAELCSGRGLNFEIEETVTAETG
jgi:hypothetical protein